MAKSIKEIQEELKALREQQAQIRANAKEYEKLKNSIEELTEQQKIKLRLLDEENKKYTQNSKSIDNLQKRLDRSKSQIKQITKDAGDLDDTFVSISNSIGQNSEYAALLGVKFNETLQTVESIGSELQKGGVTNKSNEKAILNAVSAYKSMQISIAQINKAYIQGKISNEERIRAIKDESDAFKDVAHSIDMSDINSQELKNGIESMVKEADSFGNSMQKAQLTTQSLDQVMDSFSGIPAMGELNKLLKTNIKDTLAWKAAVFALGAALGKAAFDYFGAPMKAAMQAQYEIDSEKFNTAKKLVEINKEAAFEPAKLTIEANRQNLETAEEARKIRLEAAYIPQKIEREIAKQRIENENEISRLQHEAAFATQKAVNSFNASMKSAALQFNVASKTALFGKGIGGVGYGAAQLQMAGIDAGKVASAMEAAAAATGKMPTGKMGADMAIMADRTGQSVDDISSINEYLQRSEGVSAKVAINLQEGMRAMADKAGISLGKLMKEIAEASKDALSYNIKSGKALAKQVAYANSIGVSFGDIAKAGKNMVMNYKDSIKAEMQLSTLLGEQVDLSEVRAKFAEGDTAGAMEALKAQGLDPATMDMFQQQALSEALGGLDLSSISKIAQNTGAQVGALEGASAQKGNQEFVGAKVAGEKEKAVGEARISAQQAIVDAKLSQQIAESYLNSPAYLQYQKQLNESAAKDAELAGSIAEAYLRNPQTAVYKQGLAELTKQDALLAEKIQEAIKKDKDYQKAMADQMKLDFVHGIKESLAGGLSMLGGGLLSLIGDKLVSGIGKSVMSGLGKTGIGKKISSMFGGGGGGGADTGGGGGGAPAAPTVEGPGGNVADLAGQAEKQKGLIEKIFDGIQSVLKGIKDTLVEALKLVKDVGKQLFDTLGSLITDAIKMIEKTGSQLISSVGKLLGDIMNQFKTLGPQLIQTIESIVNQAIDTVSSIGGKLIDTTTGLVDKFGKLLDKVAEIIGRVANKIATEGMSVFNTVVDGLTKASNQLPTLLGNLGKAVGSFFQGIGPGLLAFGEMMATPTAFFGIPAGAIVLAMMMGIAAALNIAAPAIEKLTPLLIGLADSIGGTFVEMLKVAQPIIEGVFNGIAKVINSVGNTIVGIINSITNSIVTFSQINAAGLIAAAGGIAAVAGALALYGGGSLIGGIMDGIGKFFGGDPVKKFQKFASIDGSALQSVAKGVSDLGSGLRNFDTGNLSDIPGALKTLNEGIIENLSVGAANLMANFGNTIASLSNSLVTFAGAITTINNQARLIDATTAAFDRLGQKLLSFPKLSDIQPAIDGIKAVAQASPTPESAQAFYTWNTAFTGFNQNMVIMSGYPELVATLVPMFEQLTGVTNRMGTELNLIAQVPFQNFLGLAEGLRALGAATPTFEQAEAFEEWNEGFGYFKDTVLEITGVTDSLSTIASTMDATALAIMNLAEAFKELAKVDTNAIDDLPWIRMTAFSSAGGKIQLVQSANKSFNVTQDTAKNIETMKLADKTNAEKLTKDSADMVRLTKNLQTLITVLAQGNQLKSAPIQLQIDGRNIANVIERRSDNTNSGDFSNNNKPSDIRLKTDIKEIGISEKGITIYQFKYIWDVNTTYQGVMAQDLIGTEFENSVIQNAINYNGQSYHMVNYSLIDVDCKEIY